MATAPSIAKSDDASGRLLRLTRGLATALGVTGIAAAIGYISLVAAQQFLGIPQLPSTATELIFGAADFAMNTFLIVGTQIASHPFMTGLFAVVLALPGFRRTLRSGIGTVQRWSRTWNMARLSMATLSAGIGIFVVFWFDLPETQLRDLLLIGAQQSTAVDTALGRRTNVILKALADSRSGLPSVQMGSIAEYSFSDSNSGVAYLRREYTENLLLVLVGWILLLESGLRQPIGFSRKLLNIIAVSFLAVATIFLPYVHGKIVRSTTFRQVSIHLKSGDKWKSGYLLSGVDHGITVLTFTAGVSQVVVLPQDSFDQIIISEPRDALGERLQLSNPIPPPTSKSLTMEE